MSKYPFPGQNFEMEVQGAASPEAQIEYLKTLLKVKEDEIATLKMRLHTQTLEKDLDQKRLDHELEVLHSINRQMQKRAPTSRIPLEALEWLEWRKLPWWKRMWKRYR